MQSDYIARLRLHGAPPLTGLRIKTWGEWASFALHFGAVCFSGPSVTCLETLNVSQRQSVQGPGGKAGVVHIYLKCLAIKQWYQLIGVQVSLFSHTICTQGFLTNRINWSLSMAFYVVGVPGSPAVLFFFPHPGYEGVPPS